jgi:polyisoprenoid-binding protein YceI
MMSKRPLEYAAGLAALAGLCALLTSCGSPSATTAPPPPTTAPPGAEAPTAGAPDPPVPTAVARPTENIGALSVQANPTAAAVQTAALAPTTAVPVPTSAPSAPVAVASPSSTASSARLVLDGSATQASYHAHEQLVGNSLPTEAVGTSPGVSGSLVVLGADGAIAADQSTFTVDLTQLKSDESRRDNFVKSNTLQTSSFPTATFVARSVQGLPLPLPTSGAATFQLLGDLTIHGVTKPVTWQVSAQFADTTVRGSATTNVNITDFGMTPPKAGPVLSIEDALALEVAFTATRAS